MDLKDGALNRTINESADDSVVECFINSTRIAEIMTTNVVAISIDESVHAALTGMMENCVSCIVATENGLPAGILTEKDVSRLVLKGKDIDGLIIRDVMSRPVQTIGPDATDYEAIRVMARKEIRRLVVTDKNKGIMGLVTYPYLCNRLEKGSVRSLKDAVMERERGLISTKEALSDMTVYIENILSLSEETAIVAADLDFHIKYYNQTAEKMCGVKAESVIGKTVMEMLKIKKVPACHFDIALETITTKGEYAFSIRLDTGSGPAFLTSRISYIKNKKGEPVGYVCCAQDITERINLENALMEGGREYRCLFEDSPVPLWEEDCSGIKTYIDGLKDSGINDLREYFLTNPEAVAECVNKIKLLDINKATMDMYGAKRKYEFADALNRIITQESYEGLRDAVIAVAEGKTRFECEAVNRTLNGEKKNINMKWNVVPGYENSYAKVLLSSIDITERKRIEGALLRESSRAQKYLDIAEVIIMAFNVAGEVTLINRKGCKILGYREEEITGRNWFDNFVSERTREENRTCFAKFLDGKMQPAEYFECVILTKAGEERIIAWNNILLKDEAGGVTGALCSGNDITERKFMEEKLIKEKMFSDSITNSLPGTFYLFDEEGRILRWNRNLESISGYSAVEISSMHPVDFFEGSDKELIINKMKEVIEKGTVVCEADMVLKNGLSIPFFFVASKIIIDDKTYVIGTGTDISDRKKAEEQLKCYLRENELLLKEIHHRVRNNLQMICSLFNLQKSSIKDRDAVEMVSECQNRIRAIALVHEKFYNSETLANINLNDYINDLVQNLFHFNEINPNRVRLETSIDNILVDVNSAIPCGLILNELVGNCLQYAFPQERKGKISVSIFLTDSDCVNITVKDNGVDLSGFYDIIEELPLGFQIVNALIKQLKGKMEIIRGDGTEYNITFRLKR